MPKHKKQRNNKKSNKAHNKNGRLSTLLVGSCVLLSAYHLFVKTDMGWNLDTTQKQVSDKVSAALSSIKSLSTSSSTATATTSDSTTPSSSSTTTTNYTDAGIYSKLKKNKKNKKKDNNNNDNDNDVDKDHSQEFREPGQMRYNWLNLGVRSESAKRLKAHQERCDLPVYSFQQRNHDGLGSDMHVYSVALCQALQDGHVLNAPRPWMYEDAKCDETAGADRKHSMQCYFPHVDNECAEAQGQSAQKITFNNLDPACPSLAPSGRWKDIRAARAATMEYVFSQVSPLLVEEAKRQHALVFPKGAPPSRQICTVHVRWGDKRSEMRLTPIESYVGAVEDLAQRRGLKPDEVTVYLATEDPAAVEAFRQKMNPAWSLHIDQFYIENLPFRDNRTQHVALQARGNMGQMDQRVGIKALGSLMVSMEADMYVIGTGSNWSRMMDELRQNIIEPRCGGTEDNPCTSVWDVAPRTKQGYMWDVRR